MSTQKNRANRANQNDHNEPAKHTTACLKAAKAYLELGLSYDS